MLSPVCTDNNYECVCAYDLLHMHEIITIVHIMCMLLVVCSRLTLQALVCHGQYSCCGMNSGLAWVYGKHGTPEHLEHVYSMFYVNARELKNPIETLTFYTCSGCLGVLGYPNTRPACVIQ